MDVSLTKRVLKIVSFGTFIAIAGPAFANPCPPGNPPTNCAPPTGSVIFDLAADAPVIPHTYTQYTTTFVASGSTTDLAFAFREDPAFWYLDNVSVTTGGGPNLVSDGDFEAASTLTGGWVASNNYGAQAPGVLLSGYGIGNSNAWVDGSVQAYDGLDQLINTVAGTTYTLSFSLTDDGGLTTAQQLSTNGDTSDDGGNGADVLVYAGAGAPVEGAAPEIDAASLPSALSLLLGALAVLRGRKYGVSLTRRLALSQNAPTAV